MDLRVDYSFFRELPPAWTHFTEFSATAKRILAIALLALCTLTATIFLIRRHIKAKPPLVVENLPDTKKLIPKEELSVPAPNVNLLTKVTTETPAQAPNEDSLVAKVERPIVSELPVEVPLVLEAQPSIAPTLPTEEPVAADTQPSSNKESLVIEPEPPIAAAAPKEESLMGEAPPSNDDEAEEEEFSLTEALASMDAEKFSEVISLADAKSSIPEPNQTSKQKWNEKTLRAIEEKARAVQFFKQLSLEGQAKVNSHAAQAKMEIADLLKQCNGEERPQIAYVFEEFVKNERSFKESLEDIQCYQREFSKIFKDPIELAKIAPKLTLKQANRLNSILLSYHNILKVISSFYSQIGSLTIQELPEFATIFLGTDFTSLLNAAFTRSQYLALNAECNETRRDQIIRLFEAIKKRSQGSFKFENENIDSLTANAFQRAARYPLTLKELRCATRKDTALYEVVNQCHMYAETICKAVNKWADEKPISFQLIKQT